MSYEVHVRALTADGASPWAGEVLVVKAPLPTLTPTPTPYVTPTPYPSSRGEVGCEGKQLLPEHGHRVHNGSREMVSDIMVVGYFHNRWVGVPGQSTPTPRGYKPWYTPVPLTFNYGFMIREASEGRRGKTGYSVALVARATQEGRWFLELRGCVNCIPQHFEFTNFDFGRAGAASARSGYVHLGKDRYYLSSFSLGNILHVLDSGYFSEEGVPFSVHESGDNHMALIANGEEYQFFVNGVEIPLEIDAADMAAIKERVGKFRYVSDGKWYGFYNRFGSARITISEGWGINRRPSYLVTRPPLGACVP